MILSISRIKYAVKHAQKCWFTPICQAIRLATSQRSRIQTSRVTQRCQSGLPLKFYPMHKSHTPKALQALLLVWMIGLLLSGAAPYDRLIWLMEVLPVLILLPLLWRTKERFEFTTLVYVLITLHGLVLMLGGAYSYARVPLGFWMQDWFGWTRNNYDKIGHFAQGFIPALVARELLIRIWQIKPGKLLSFLVVCICLAISAFYELVEWWSALLLGSGADEFLATQGDPWDTQSDMCMALIGALSALIMLSVPHQRAIAKQEEFQAH